MLGHIHLDRSNNTPMTDEYPHISFMGGPLGSNPGNLCSQCVVWIAILKSHDFEDLFHEPRLQLGDFVVGSIHIEPDAKVLAEVSIFCHFESLLVELIDELVDFAHIREVTTQFNNF